MGTQWLPKSFYVLAYASCVKDSTDKTTSERVSGAVSAKANKTLRSSTKINWKKQQLLCIVFTESFKRMSFLRT